MNRENQLKSCKKCLNRKFDTRYGIICRLTMKMASFESKCPDFNLDKKEQEIVLQKEEDNIIFNFKTASSSQRLIHWFIDSIFIIIFAYLMLLLISVAHVFSNAQMIKFSIFIMKNGINSWYMSLALYFSFAFIIYYVVFEFFYERTPAKMITRTKVVNLKGTKASLSEILGRTFCRFIPFEVFSFLSIDAIGWHDSFSSTRIVKKTREENVLDEIIDI